MRGAIRVLNLKFVAGWPRLADSISGDKNLRSAGELSSGNRPQPQAADGYKCRRLRNSCKMWPIFRRISLPAVQSSGIMGRIGATTPRLHGFHRFLPRLWELF